MHKIIPALIIGLFIGFGSPANACQMSSAPAAAEAAGQQDVYAQRVALMQERDALLLETVQLLKEIAKDKDLKAKAESLELRIKANIEKHGKAHAMMMGGGEMTHKKDGCADKEKPCPMKGGAPSDKKAN